VATRSRILIIDDEEVVADSCTQILQDGTCEVAAAPDGAHGLRQAQEFHPDLVFVDLKMPGMSGFEVLEKLHDLDPTIVAIVITGFATVSSAVDSMKHGAFDFLPKPFTPDELRLITRRGLEKRALVLETMALRREKEMLREHFAAIVSHELKSPLNAVQQNLFALGAELASRLTEDQRTRLERCSSRVNDLMQLIHTWLRVMSTDIEKVRENFIPTAVPSVITKAVEVVQPEATRKEVDIRTDIQTPLARVQGDEGTLVEALVNILGNAVKYSRVGSPVHVSARQEEDHLVICVADTGVGIAKEDLPHIFEDFYRGKPGEAAQHGSGLGLAITRRIVEVHGGSVSVESELGHGSTFIIHLPALAQPHVETDPLSVAQTGGMR
jgi:signal transduction histidine kinase